MKRGRGEKEVGWEKRKNGGRKEKGQQRQSEWESLD